MARPLNPLPTAAPQPQPSGTPAPVQTSTFPALAQKILLILAAAVACLVLGYLLFQLVRRIRGTRRLPGAAVARSVRVAPRTSPAPDAEPEAAVVVGGLERALQVLDEDRSADDAIVRAWLGLEEASVESGAGRLPAETPTEYAARVISRFDADQRAVDTLVALYQGVRFGTLHADAAAIRTARDCVRRLAESWHADTQAGAR
jgi:hypothetical protein